MQQALSKRGMVLLAAFLAVFAMAFALFAAQPALADDNLAAGDAELSVQSGDKKLEVYIQHGTETPELWATYTSTELETMAVSGGDFIAGLYYENDEWYVTTAVSYVTLDYLLSDAGVYWAKGATVEYGDGTNSYSFTYEDVDKMNFYPNTPNMASIETEKTGIVLGLKNTQGATIGKDKTAADVRDAAEASAVTDASPLAITGTLADDYKKHSGKTVDKARFVEGVTQITVTYPTDTQVMYRLYNPNSGEHFYTADSYEKDMLVKAGWDYEGTAWIAPKLSNTPVYRVYNPNAGDHHYTTDPAEMISLVQVGWNYEGVGWCSDDAKTVELFRLYNPNAKAGAHHYTTSSYERDELVKVGWKSEGTAWYGISA